MQTHWDSYTSRKEKTITGKLILTADHRIVTSRMSTSIASNQDVGKYSYCGHRTPAARDWRCRQLDKGVSHARPFDEVTTVRVTMGDDVT